MKILLLEKIHEDAVDLLSKAGSVHLMENLDPDSVKSQFVDSSAVITRGRGRINRDCLLAGARLKCVARCGAGTDNIDVATATQLGLPVVFSPDGTTFGVAEHAIMLMLAVGRRLNLLDREVRNGNWEIRNHIGSGLELTGKTLGIMGLGRIGRRIAHLGEAFGMNVIYWSKNSRDDRYQFADLESLFRWSDVLSISLSLNDETRGIADARLISLMKPTAILINTARGEMVDEGALCRALMEKRLAGAGIDVMSAEPPPQDHPLFNLDNVVINPHVAVLTDVTYRKMCVATVEQVVNILQGRTPDIHHIRNPEVVSK